MARLFALSVASTALVFRIVSSQSASIDSCEILGDVLSICEIETPSFTFLPVTAWASCLCGSQLGTIAWGPSSWDSIASACAVQDAATNNIVGASAANVLDTFCTDYAGSGQTYLASQPLATSTAATAQNSVIPPQ